MPEVRTVYQHRTAHYAYIDEKELERLAIAAVAAKLGIDASADHIKATAIVTTHVEGSLGTRRARIEVEILDNHEGKPREGVEHVANGTLSPSITGDGSGQPLPSIDPA